MLFNSLSFAVFLPIVFGLYWLLQRKSLAYQNILLLASSYYFYGSWDVRFLGLIVLSSLVDYVIGLKLGQEQRPQLRSFLLGISLVVNLGILGCFKYANFFVESFVAFGQSLGWDMEFVPWNIILPVGISFYTFQTLSYTIDIYRKEAEPIHDPIAFFAFVAFFPQLVAGPIERARDLLPQFLKKRHFDPAFATEGLQLMLWGLFKKIVIADQLATYVNLVFADVHSFQGIPLILASLGFTIQIYCDFSGYSDIAIGTACLFGFRLTTNFLTPYFATSIRDFWNRWHITLFSWFRDYIYFPLGGSRVGRGKWVFNILIVFGISGLWHGAAFTFIAFGLVHGLLYLGEWKVNQLFPRKKELPNWIHGGITFFLVVLSWVLFRAISLSDAWQIYVQMPQGMFAQLATMDAFIEATTAGFFDLKEGFYLFLSLLIFIFLEINIRQGEPVAFFQQLSSPLRWGLYYLLIAWILIFGAYEKVQEFIYFQF